MTNSLAPFSCTYTREIPDLLHRLGCTLVLSTYQAGKVIFLSAKPGEDDLIQLPRTFQKPMGLAVDGVRMAIATRDEVVVLANSPALAQGYPKQPGKYNGLFAPRATYYTGELDLHDLAWGHAGLWAANTRFSCLSLIDDHYSFVPQWQPPFIRELTPDDHCHLNGMALVDGEPRYVTALGATDAPGGWRPGKLTGGILMHIPSGEIILRDLPMPHSPRVFGGVLYFLNSATGELAVADPEAGVYEILNRMPGYVRGLACCGDYLFVGLSKIRQKHRFSDMPIAREETFAGIAVVHQPTGFLAGSIRYLTSCEEVYDVQVLPGLCRPGILNHTTPLHRFALSTPQAGFWSDPARDEAAERR